MAVALTQTQLGWDEDAAASYKRAAELGPREPKIFYNWGVLLDSAGRVIEARAALDRALILAPDSVFFRLYRAGAEIGWSGDIAQAKTILSGLRPGQDPDGRVTAAYCTLAIMERDFSEALRLLEAYGSEKLPRVGGAYGGFDRQQPKAASEGIVRLFAGDRAGAAACFESIREQAEADLRAKASEPVYHAEIGVLYAQMGRKEAAMAEAARAIELDDLQKVPPKRRTTLTVAQLYAWAGEPDLAFQQIERFFAGPSLSYTIHYFRLDPAWDPLRNDPRFQKLLE
jgi:serine/threonine-protein kinase